MQRIEMIKTKDGILHESVERAKLHLDNLYGNQLTPICIELAKLDGKYGPMVKWIDDNIERFRELLVLRDDLRLLDDDETNLQPMLAYPIRNLNDKR